MTSQPSPTHHAKTIWRRWIVAVAALIGVLITFKLGLWQMSRAEEKLRLQASIEAQALQPALTAQDLAQDAKLWQSIHRPLALQGQWLSESTVYLDNRNHQ